MLVQHLDAGIDSQQQHTNCKGAIRDPEVHWRFWRLHRMGQDVFLAVGAASVEYREPATSEAHCNRRSAAERRFSTGLDPPH